MEYNIEKFKPKPGSWECNSCLVQNGGDKSVCVACGTQKPGKSTFVVTPNVTQEEPNLASLFGGTGKEFVLKPSEESASKEKPLYTFGTSESSSDSQTTKPLFTFGAHHEMPTSSGLPTTTTVTTFTFGDAFGIPVQEKSNEAKTETSPIFNFGAPLGMPAPRSVASPQSSTDFGFSGLKSTDSGNKCDEMDKTEIKDKDSKGKNLTTDVSTEAPEEENIKIGELPKATNKPTNKETQVVVELAEKSMMTDNTNESLAFNSRKLTITKKPVSDKKNEGEEMVFVRASEPTTEEIKRAEKFPLPRGNISLSQYSKISTVTKEPVSKTEDNDKDLVFVRACEPTTEEIRRAEKLLLPKGFFLFEREPEVQEQWNKELSSSKMLPLANSTKDNHRYHVPEKNDGIICDKSPNKSHVFGAGNPQSFVSFAQMASSVNGGGFGGSPSSQGFSGKGSKLFNNTLSEEREPEQGEIHFQPVIPLPEKVEVVSGEEEEIVLFSNRAKLYRFDINASQWKERGVGDIKILKHQKSRKTRILMRREQIHKICANHFITVEMQLKPNASSDRSWVWQTLADFSEEVQKAEQLAVRFKTLETAQEFKSVFEECQQYLCKDTSSADEIISHGSPKPSEEEEVNAKGKEDEKEEVDAKDKDEEEEMDAKDKEDEEEEVDAKDKEDEEEEVGEKGKEDEEDKKDEKDRKDEINPTSIDIELEILQTEDIVEINEGDVNTGSSDGGCRLETTKSETTSDEAPANIKTSDQSGDRTGKEFIGNKEKHDDGNSGKFFFGSSNIARLSFQDIAKKSPSEADVFGSTTKSKPKPFSGAGEQLFQSNEDKDDEEKEINDESCDHIYFEPVIPLPEKVVVKTGEENEQLVFKERCKLYRFEYATKQWKERGVGDIKLLLEPNSKKARVVMRRELIHKLCANHLITAAMELKSNAGSEKSWVWHTMADMSEGESNVEQLAVRFKSPEIARKFKEKFDYLKGEIKGFDNEESESLNDQSIPDSNIGEIMTTKDPSRDGGHKILENIPKSSPDTTQSFIVQDIFTEKKEQEGKTEVQEPKTIASSEETEDDDSLQHVPSSKTEMVTSEPSCRNHAVHFVESLQEQKDTALVKTLTSNVSGLTEAIHSSSATESSSFSETGRSSVSHFQSSSSVTQTRIVKESVKSVRQVRVIQSTASGAVGVEDLNVPSFSPTLNLSPVVSPMSSRIQELGAQDPEMTLMKLSKDAQTNQLQTEKIEDSKEVYISGPESIQGQESAESKSLQTVQSFKSEKRVQEQKFQSQISVGASGVLNQPPSCSPEISKMLEEIGPLGETPDKDGNKE